jgi:DNA polymerase-3 subunit beta
MDGNEVTIAFNSKYILEFLKILDDEFITLYLNSAIAPCVIRSIDSDEFLYLVLPVRINA